MNPSENTYSPPPDLGQRLAVACEKGNAQEINVILSHGGNANQRLADGRTVLFLAAQQGHVAAVKALLQGGADSNASHHNGWTSLFYAASSGHVEVVEALLQAGASIDTYDKTSLMRAAEDGHVEVVKVLLQAGADINATCSDGRTSLFFAAQAGRLAVVEALLQAGADINATRKDGRTSLFFAARNGHTTTVKALLQAGANPDKRAVDGATALSLARKKGHTEITAILLPVTSGSSATVNSIPWADIGKTAGQGLQSIVRAGFNFAKEVKSNSAASETVTDAEKPPASTTNVFAMDTLLIEMNSMVGLETVKAEVLSHISLLRVQKMRREKGLAVPNQSLHMVFSGSPGTGKTSIARLLAKTYREMGILSKGTFTETDRSGLVGQYVGHTAEKVQQVVRKSLGGVLFIDEAYSLSAGEDSYGREAIDTLLKLMEDNRDNLIVIVAGYAEQMERFVESNPGLRSRFNKFLHFEDYTPDELVAIFSGLSKQNDYEVSDGAHRKLHDIFAGLYRVRTSTFANGRLVRNTFEKAISKHAVRISGLASVTSEELTLLEASDIS